MKYPYHIEYLHGLPVMVLPKGMEVVTTFLTTDVQGSSGAGGAAYYIAAIDRVLNGEIPSETITGNACLIEIQKEKTRIVLYLAEDDDPDNEYVIETQELRELIVARGEMLNRPSPSQEQ